MAESTAIRAIQVEAVDKVFGNAADRDRELTVIILSTWPEFTSIERRITELDMIDAVSARLD